MTTHFNELKAFAAATEGFENARMEFDKHTLQPLYKLTIGEAGESYALQIAEKLGIGRTVIERARELVTEQQSRRGSYDPWKGAVRRKRSAGTGEAGEAEGAERADRVGPQNSPAEEAEQAKREYEIGDAVYVSSLGRTGIVYAKKDSRGMVGVMIQKQKITVNHKRLKPYLSKEELYPEDYDLDIIFESKENRKKRKLMAKRHVEGLSITLPEEEK